jgi:hypothetical protein
LFVDLVAILDSRKQAKPATPARGRQEESCGSAQAMCLHIPRARGASQAKRSAQRDAVHRPVVDQIHRGWWMISFILSMQSARHKSSIFLLCSGYTDGNFFPNNNCSLDSSQSYYRHAIFFHAWEEISFPIENHFIFVAT